MDKVWDALELVDTRELKRMLLALKYDDREPEVDLFVVALNVLLNRLPPHQFLNFTAKLKRYYPK